MSSATRHRMLVLAAALLFSTGGAVVKACDFNAWQIACFRSGIAAVALAIVAPAWRRSWNGRVLLAGSAYAATMLLFVSGNKLTTAANLIFLQATAPLYLIVLGPLLLRERPRRSDLVVAAVLATGMGMFFLGSEAPVDTAPHPVWGNVVGAFTGLAWALTLTGLRWLGRDGDDGGDRAGAAVLAGNTLACLICLPLVFPLTGGRWTDVVAVTYLGVFQIGLAYVCMTRGVRRVPAFEASLLLLLEPVASTGWAWLVHGERPGPWSLAGCGVILAATLGRAFSHRSSRR